MPAFRRGTGALSAEQEAAAREMYEAGEMTIAEIAVHFGVSAGVVVGMAKRHWTQRTSTGERNPVPTLFDRMNALEANLASVLRAYPPGTGKAPPPEPQKRRAKDWAHR